ncbi:MAG TPA: cytochrome b/b6 domain-containing protein [Anaerolineales bacterium]|nr:cytochrome b/b6 domain-containing protein [Anaerolineales bacterium]
MAGFPALAIYMVLGITVLVLLIAHLIVRGCTRRPPWATTGSRFLDLIGGLTAWALYFFASAVVIRGLVLAVQTNRLARTFGAAANPPRPFQPGQRPPPAAPPQAGQFAPRGAEDGGFFPGAFHGSSWALLLILIVLDAGAALHHQFILRDDPFSRRRFGRRSG